MSIIELRREWEEIIAKNEKPSKSFRELEKEYTKRFEKVVSAEDEVDEEEIFLPEFVARHNKGLLKIESEVLKKAVAHGYRGKSFYWQNR